MRYKVREEESRMAKKRFKKPVALIPYQKKGKKQKEQKKKTSIDK